MPEERDILQEILQRVTRTETKVEALEMKVDGISSARDIAIQAMESTKQAHHRINELKKETEDEIKEIKEKQSWLWKTVIGAFITGAIGLLWKGIGG